MMALDKKFAVRGLLAFLCFMELVNCFRSLLPSLFTLPHERLTESFIQNKIFNLVDLSSDTQNLIGTIFGFYSLLNAVVFVHSALHLHHPHILSLAATGLLVKVVFLVTSHRHASSLTIPLVMTAATLAGILALVWDHVTENSGCGARPSENEMLLRAMKKSARSKKKSD